MKNAKKAVSKVLIIAKALKNVSFIKNLKLNSKPNSILYLQKNKSLPEVIETLSPFANKTQFYSELKFVSKVTNALTKLINHNDLHNVNSNDATFISKNLKKMKQKPHSSISNNFFKIFGLMIYIINHWSKNFVYVWLKLLKKEILNYYDIMPPEVRPSCKEKL